MNFRLRLHRRWNQFCIETSLRLDSFLGVVVNLYFSRYKLTSAVQIIVLVDSWREMLLLGLLRILTVIPRHKVYVIKRSNDIYRVVSGGAGQNLVFVTNSLYSKHYQSLLRSDLKPSLVII